MQFAVLEVRSVAIALNRINMNFFKRCFVGRDDISMFYDDQINGTRNYYRRRFHSRYCLTSNLCRGMSFFQQLSPIKFSGTVCVCLSFRLPRTFLPMRAHFSLHCIVFLLRKFRCSSFTALHISTVKREEKKKNGSSWACAIFLATVDFTLHLKKLRFAK